jgi:hypothetical protein
MKQKALFWAFSMSGEASRTSNQIRSACLIGAVSDKAQAKQIIDFRIFL